MAVRMPLRRTRRWELDRGGTLLAPRQMLRRNLATGGDPVTWVWRRRVQRPRSVVLLCDVSGSMERHARLLLRFCHALARSEVPTEAFCFGTRLTRITPLLRRRDQRRPRARLRGRRRLVGWHPHRRRVPRVQPALGTARAAQQRHRARGQRRLGPRRPARRGHRDGAPAAQLPPAHLAQSAGRLARIPPAGGGHGGRLPARRRLPAGHDLASLERLAQALGRMPARDPASRCDEAPEREGAAGGAGRVARRGRAGLARWSSAPSARHRERRARRCWCGDGRLAGSVSGGCVEGAAFEEVETARASGRSRVIRYGISDEQAWDVGLACGGTIDVLMEPSIAPAVELAARELGRRGDYATTGGFAGPSSGAGAARGWRTAEPAAHVGRGRTACEARPATPADVRSATLAADILERGRSRTVELAGRSWFVEAFPRQPRLVIVGAVQVAIAAGGPRAHDGLCHRRRRRPATFATRERFPDVDRSMVGWPDEVADAIGLGPARRGRGPQPRRQVR